MNNQQLFLAWLRTTSPMVYSQALRKVLKKPRTLGGLNGDLVDSMTAPATMGAFGQDDSSMPEITITADSYTPPDLNLNPFPDVPVLNPSDLTTPSLDLTNIAPPDIQITTPTDPSTGTSWIDSIAKAVTTVATTALRSDSQSNLVRLNASRAQQGLPPVDQYGRPIQPSGLAPASSAIYRLETALTGGGVGGMSPLLLLGGVGLLAFFFMRKR